jgi:hypothetical protein
LKANAAAPGVLENPLIEPNDSLRRVAFAIGTVLARAGIEAVLCGGSAATFYAPDAYQSEDLDFVLASDTDGSDVRTALASLGYRFRNGMFSQDASRFTVEFPRGPLMIGNGLVVDVLTLHEDDSILQIISPTDAVCDRLNKYAAWDDFSALRAAVGIARAADVNLAAVRAFLEREGRGVFAPRYAEAWRIFDRRVRETP